METNRVTHKISLVAVFIALAMILSYIETLFPTSLLIPGVKLGLANLVVLIPLYRYGFWEALVISVTRVILVGITFGSPFTIIYGLTGAILSLLVMASAKKYLPLSMVGVSVLGGISHNIGQLVVAAIIINNQKMFFYLPILLVAGVVTGLIIGLLSRKVYSHLLRQ